MNAIRNEGTELSSPPESYLERLSSDCYIDFLLTTVENGDCIGELRSH